MSWYPTELVTCPRCWLRFSTPIDMLEHRRVHATNGCTPTIRRYRRMQRENPELAKRHAHKFED